MSKPRGDKAKAPPVLRATGALRFDVATQTVGVDTMSLPDPARVFAAQLCRVDSVGSAFRAFFAQSLPPRNRLVSLVAVQLNDDAMKNFHRTLTPRFRESLTRFSTTTADDLGINDDQMEQLEPERTFTVTANVGRVTITGQGAQIDWFELSPHTIRRLSLGLTAKDPPGVLTVTLGNSLLARFIQQMDSAMGGPSETDENEDDNL
ncbi:MAG: hypothetical protein M9894_39640 [Planctomycetes bacterium]|nr:hypothetical protein [Planctomycetota bacterium]